MRKYETYTEEVEKKKQIGLVCDVCGEQISWSMYERCDFSLLFETGYQYPEGGSGPRWEIDICIPCFTEKLIPWVESHGFTKIEQGEWEY